jgi:hypothetical protein
VQEASAGAGAAITGAVDLATTWAISFGPLLSYSGQSYRIPPDGFTPDSGGTASRVYELGAFVALRRHL